MKALLIALLIVISGCSSDNLIVHSNNKDVHINVEIADSERERTNGLMFRENLCGNCGMLFIFDDSDFRSFWMKNTLISLDMIFINENFVIVDIKNVDPCTTEVCGTYSNKAKYVLEVNEGYTRENNIKVGDTIALK